MVVLNKAAPDGRTRAGLTIVHELHALRGAPRPLTAYGIHDPQWASRRPRVKPLAAPDRGQVPDEATNSGFSSHVPPMSPWKSASHDLHCTTSAAS